MQRATQGLGRRRRRTTFVSSKEHKGKVKLTSTRGTREETMEMEMESAARWVAVDCGDIKPRP